MSALKTEFGGDRGDLFQLAFKTGLLTVITFGIYRFWQTTRFRRWYWSSVRPGGSPLEYTGTAHEKLMGFLFAVIVLAVYLALFNTVAMLVAIRLTDGARDYLTWGLAVTPLALVPIIFMARYRARRYILSRTRWRGIRFGMSAGAWGYAWRACMYWTLTLLSLGLLWPMMTFQLEKYVTDRTWFGTARFTQFGYFGKLYGPIIPFLVCLYGSIALPVLAVTQSTPAYAYGVLVTVPLAVLFGVYYRVACFRVMASLKTLGDGLEFDIHPRTRVLVRIQIIGNMLTSVMTSFVTPVVMGIVFGIMYLAGSFTPEMIENPPANILALIFALSWLTIFVFYNVFRQVFIVYPMVRHVAETLEIHEPSLMNTIRQRDRDRTIDAGGFADALDVGAAF